MTEVRWWIVVPVKGTTLAKSRLAAEWDGDVRALARAFALDVLGALHASSDVQVVMVTPPDERRELEPLVDARVIFVDDPGTGLSGAIRAGVSRARRDEDVRVGVLLGDLPGLRPADVDRALALAAGAPRTYLPDADGTGTTLVTALPGHAFESHFGPDSAARHAAAGLTRLDLDAVGIRRDVDTLADLASLTVGPATAAVLR